MRHGLLRQFILYGITAVSLLAVLLVFAWTTAPKGSEQRAAVYSEEQLEEVRRLRDVSFDPDNPLRAHVPVDYGEGETAAWYPRIDPDILREMVAEGELPPVAERVGPEPCVVRGPDGVGEYGGSWLRLNHLGVGNRTTYTTLVRFSPQGFPLVPHVAKAWQHSSDYREWTFSLRRGMKWSDGHPFTSEDIRYWFEEEMLNEALGGTVPEIMKVNGKQGRIITYPDDPHKVTFSFPDPNGVFLALLATYSGTFVINSAAHYRRQFHPDFADPETLADLQRQTQMPSARALYGHMAHWQSPSHPRLWPWLVRAHKANPPEVAVRNPYYFCVDEQGRQLPYIDQIMSDKCSQDLVAIKAAGGAATFQSRYLSYDQYTYLMDQRKQGNYQLYHWYGGDRSWFVLQPNLNRRISAEHPDWEKKRDLMRSKTFRQALSLAINRDAIIKAEYNYQAEPAQVAPGRESPFFHEKAFKAYTEFDPGRAGRMLDELGLVARDYEGFRTFADGTRMTWYIDYTRGLTSDRPVQFVVNDWQAVGIRTIPRQRDRTLWSTEREGLLHDFNVWIANGEHYPLIQPRFFAPVQASFFSIGYFQWLRTGGLEGDPEARGEELPRDHPLFEALMHYRRACATGDLAEQVRLFRPALDIAAEHVWTINICATPPVLVVINNNLRNFPDTAVYSWDFQSPGNAYPELWCLAEDNNSPGAIAAIKEQIRTPVLRPNDPVMGTAPTGARSQTSTASVAAPPAGSRFVGSAIRILVWGTALLLVVLVCLRHPFIARRLLIMLPTLAVISVIVFTVIQLPPGDYLTSLLVRLEQTGDMAAQQEIDELTQMFYLDRSVPERYVRWLGLPWFASFEKKDMGLLQGHLGLSMETRGPVNQLVGDRLLLTFLISLGTILFTWALALPTGIYSAVKQYSVGDYILTFVGFIGMCVPAFLLALLLMYAANEWFGVSIGGLLSPDFATQPEWDWPKVLDLFKHIWLPIVVLGVGGTAGMIRVMRANLLDELKKPYVVTARAKGVRPLKLLLKYPVRIALNPFISGIGHIFPQLVSGGAIVAIVLSLPTVGPLMLEALMTQDMYLAGSMLMVLSLLGVFGTLVSDLLLLALDPRIRYGAAGET